MKNKSLYYSKKHTLLHFALAVIILIPTIGFGQIVAWQFGVPAATGSETTYNATTNNENINTSILTRGAGIRVNPLANGFTSDNWNSSSPTKLEAISYNEYIEFKIQPKVGFSTSLSTLNAKIRRTSNGPKNYSWQYSINGVTFINIFDTIVSVVTDGQEQKEILLSSISELQNVDNGTIITFRIYAWGASNNDASFGFAKTTTGSTTNCLAIGGVVEALTLSSSASIANVSKTINSTATVEITSNTTWNAVSNQGWLNVSGGTKGNGTLTIATTETNPTIFARTATVTVSAANLSNTITVTQEAGDATLSISSGVVSVAKTANSSGSVNVTSNSTWSAATIETWLTVGNGATGNGTLNFTVEANPAITTRTATVTVKATGTANQTVQVTQAAGDATLSVSATTASIAKTASSTSSITVTSNSSWTATSDKDWLTVTSGATGNGNLIFTAKNTNPEITTRSAIVTIKANGTDNQMITVTQAAGDATLSVSATTANIAKTASSTSNITVTSNSPWTTTSDKDWLTVTSGATGNGTLIFTAKYTNQEITTRSAIVTIKANGTNNQIITVTQAAGDATLSVSTSTAAVSKTAGSSASISVLSNSTWTATSDQDWLTLTPETTGNGTLTITTTTANPFLTTRFASVTIKATGAESKTVIVTQAIGDATFSVSANTADIDANANNSASINVNSNVSWTATSSASWLTISSISTGSGILTVSASNTLEASRQAIVTISAQGFPSKTVIVTQAWGANTNKFQLNMTITAIASINDKEIVNSNFQLAAFIGDECRGVAKLQYVDALKRYIAFMMVWGNKDDMNKNVTFKSFNQLNNIQLAATNTALTFMPESRSGSPANPYTINFVQEEASYGSILVTPGGLSQAIKNAGLDITTLTSLKLLGNIDARDFKTMRDSIPLLADLNMSGVTIMQYSGFQGTIGIGNFYYPINEISINAFSINGKGKATLKTVIIPLSAKSIGNNAFENCTGLTEITIPASISSISTTAFFGNKCFITVDANNAAYSSIDSVLFDKNQTTLIFCPTSKTGNYSIPSTVSTINESAFYGCKGLTSVIVPSSVTTIADKVFSGCTGLTSVTLPPTLTTIGYLSFYSCSNIATITIPASVTLIKTSAFYSCRFQSIIAYPTQPPSLESNALGINKDACILHVPTGSLAAYKAAMQWQDFTIQAGIITITIPTPLSSFSSGSGAASDIQTFKVSALVINSLVITAPTGYEIREYGVGNFGSSITFTPVAYTVAEKVIEVRISSNLAVGLISGDLVCSSSGVTSKNVAVTGTVSAPSVTSVSVPTNGIYKTDDELLFTVNFNAPITVTNSPTLPLIINSAGTVNANYVSGSGTSALLFSYKIVANDYDNDGITVGASINANGGALKSALGVDAVLALNNVGSTANLQIDAIVPTISIISTLLPFTSCKNNISTEQSFIVSGIHLIASISITAPSGFEICKTSDGTYATSLTLAQTDGIINATTVYVRMASTVTGNPAGNIKFSSTGATTQKQNVSGSVIIPTVPAFTIMANPSSGAVCPGNTITLTAKEKNGLTFDGEDDYVDLGDINELKNVTQFSIEAMIYCTESNNYKTIFSKREDHENKIQLYFNDNKGLTFAVGNNDLIEATMTSAFTLNTWVHVVAVYNSLASSNEEKIKLYLNGVAASLNFSGTFPTSTSESTSPALLGSEGINSTPNVCFTGKMYDFRIWSTARTGAEVLTSLNQSISSNSNGLISEYKLDGEGTNLTAYNNIGSNYNGTLNNFDTVNPWTNSSTPASFSWSDGISNGVPFIPTKSGVYTVTVSSTSGNCPVSVSSSVSITVNPLPIPTITGNSTACVNSTENTYSTEEGMTSYIWTISSGGKITAGGGTTDNTCTVTWATAGANTVSVNYNNTNGCMAATAKAYNVMVNPLPESPALNIKVEPASGTVCAGNPVTLTVLKNTDLTFDGTNDNIDLGNIIELNNASKFTLEAMVYCTQNNFYRTLFSKRDSHTSKIQLLFNNNNKLTFAVGNNDLMEAAMSSAFPLNTWVHLVAQYNATASTNQEKMKIYINGEAATLTYSGTVPSATATNTANAIIGSESTTSNYRINYSGKMNDFRIWNTERSTAQILSSVNQCLSDSKSGLIAEYKMDGLAGTSIANNSAGANYNGNLNNFDLTNVWNLSTVGCGNNPSYSWSDGIVNGVPFTPTKSGNYTVTATINNGTCSISESTSVAITVNPLPIPIITGKTAVCINSTGNVYSTESGMSGYSWSVSAGGTITAGGGTNDNAVTVTWTRLGTNTVSVNYSNTNNCTANTSTTYNISVVNPSISASASLVNVNATANNSSTVDITSNTSWTATSSNTSWLTVNAGGTGNGTITFTATANPNITTRSTTVTIKATGATDQTVIVTQAAGDAYLSVTATKVNIDVTANNTATVNVTSNTEWTATSNENWLTISDGGQGNGKLTFTATNTTESLREALVTITGIGVEDQSVIVSQIWGVNPLKFQQNMTLTASAFIDDNEIANSDMQLAAFIDDECRGIGSLEYIDANKRYMVSLTVLGNVEDENKRIIIKGLNQITKNELTATNSMLEFIPDSKIGTEADPYNIYFVQKVTNQNIVYDQSLKVYPNPIKNVLHINCQPGDIQELQLTDASGRNLIGYTKMKTNYINTSHLVKGVYLLHVKSNGSMSIYKIVKN